MTKVVPELLEIVKYQKRQMNMGCCELILDALKTVGQLRLAE